VPAHPPRQSARNPAQANKNIDDTARGVLVIPVADVFIRSFNDKWRKQTKLN
jgi:hypothetical protein